MQPRFWMGGAALAVALMLVACGGSDSASPTPTTPTPTPSPSPSPAAAAATITITSSGASPQSVTVAAGGRVTFVNNDTRPHTMSSDPHPTHTDCPEINQAGFIAAGQSGTTGNLNAVRTCGFHDHDQPSNASLRGTITIR